VPTGSVVLLGHTVTRCHLVQIVTMAAAAGVYHLLVAAEVKTEDIRFIDQARLRVRTTSSQTQTAARSASSGVTFC